MISYFTDGNGVRFPGTGAGPIGFQPAGMGDAENSSFGSASSFQSNQVSISILGCLHLQSRPPMSATYCQNLIRSSVVKNPCGMSVKRCESLPSHGGLSGLNFFLPSNSRFQRGHHYLGDSIMSDVVNCITRQGTRRNLREFCECNLAFIVESPRYPLKKGSVHFRVFHRNCILKKSCIWFAFRVRRTSRLSFSNSYLN